MNGHLSEEEIEQYIDSEYISLKSGIRLTKDNLKSNVSEMNSEKLIQIEEHLVNCDICLKKVTKALDFSITFHQWLEEKPTVEQKMMYKILKATQSEESVVQKRIMKWLEDWQAFIDNTVEVFLDTTYNGISNITKLINKVDKAKKNSWTFRYPVESFAMRGNPDLSFEKKVENALFGQIRGEEVLEIKAQSKKKSITIKCKGNRKKHPSPIVVLIPLQGGEPLISVSHELKNSDQREILIEGLKPGKYLLAIEPDNLQ